MPHPLAISAAMLLVRTLLLGALLAVGAAIAQRR